MGHRGQIQHRIRLDETLRKHRMGMGEDRAIQGETYSFSHLLYDSVQESTLYETNKGAVFPSRYVRFVS